MFEELIMKIRKKIAKLLGKSYIRTGKCNQCGSCCTMILLLTQGALIDSKEEFEQLKEVFPEYERFYIRCRDEAGHLLFTCKYLGENRTCGDYKGRPLICRQYPNEELFRKGGILVSDCGYNFIPVEDFADVLKETMGREAEKNRREHPEKSDPNLPEL